MLDLLIDEAAGRVHVSPAFAEAAFHDNVQVRLDRILGAAGPGIVEADREQVGPGACNRRSVGDARQKGFHLLGASDGQIEIGGAGNLGQVRSRQQRLLHDLDLGIEVALHRKALEQRTQHRLGVDVDFSGGGIRVRYQGDGGPTDDTGENGNRQRIPAAAPHGIQITENLGVAIHHGSEALCPASVTVTKTPRTIAPCPCLRKPRASAWPNHARLAVKNPLPSAARVNGDRRRPRSASTLPPERCASSRAGCLGGLCTLHTALSSLASHRTTAGYQNSRCGDIPNPAGRSNPR